MRRLIRKPSSRYLLAVLAFSSVVACGGSDAATTPLAPSAIGAWTLSTINGTALPFTLMASGGNKSEAIGSTLTIVQGGSYTATFIVRNTTNGQQSTQSSSQAGTYVVNGTAISLRTNSDGTVVSGSVSGNSLTLTEEGAVYLYVR